MSQASDPSTSEPSLLEYARFHCLAVNHLEYNHFDDLEDLIQTAQVNLADPTGAPTLTFAQPPSEDNIQCAREVAWLLASAMKAPKLPPWESVLPRYQKPRRLKLELPLLTTDNEEDMRGFGGREEPVDTMFNLLLTNIDERKDEGFSWPAWYGEYPKSCMDAVRGEKLDVAKEAWQYLQKVRRSEFSEEDRKAVFDQCGKYEKVSYFIASRYTTDREAETNY